MLRVLAWMGLYVGTPSAATWGMAFITEPFVVLFALSAFTLLLAVLPYLGEPAHRH